MSRWLRDETARTGNITKFGILSDDFDLRDTILIVRRRKYWYHTTEGVKRQTFDVRNSIVKDVYEYNLKVIKLVFTVFSSKPILSSI